MCDKMFSSLYPLDISSMPCPRSYIGHKISPDISNILGRGAWRGGQHNHLYWESCALQREGTSVAVAFSL